MKHEEMPYLRRVETRKADGKIAKANDRFDYAQHNSEVIDAMMEGELDLLMIGFATLARYEDDDIRVNCA